MSGIKKTKSFGCYKYNMPQYTKPKVQSSQQIKERKKRKEKKSRNREKLRPVHAEWERDWKGQRELANLPNVVPMRDRVQRVASKGKSTVGLCGFLIFSHFSLLTQGYITKSMVRISPSVKILIFFFHCWHVDAVSEKRKKKKKKKKKTAWTPESSTCRTPTRRQKWRVGAT